MTSPAELAALLQEVDSLKAELDTLRPFDPELLQRIEQKLRLEWNYHSNALEGNTLTYGETKLLILHGLTAQGKPLRHHFEITGHNEALRWVMDLVKEERPLTEQFIRELHKLLLKERYPKKIVTPDGVEATTWVEVGQYKTKPNHVLQANGETFFFATPEETPVKMQELVAWYRAEQAKKETHPLLLAVEFHYRFVRIHPFDDGNGRVARILMNFILMQNGYPPVVIRKEDRDTYLLALQQADAGVLIPLINLIGENLLMTEKTMLEAVRTNSLPEDEQWKEDLAQLNKQIKKNNNDNRITT